MSHFIVKCSICETVVMQCRCPSTEKPVTYVVCEKCKLYGEDLEDA